MPYTGKTKTGHAAGVSNSYKKTNNNISNSSSTRRGFTKTDHAAGISSSGGTKTSGTSGIEPNYTQRKLYTGSGSTPIVKQGESFPDTTPKPKPKPQPVKQSTLRIKRKRKEKERPSERNKTKLGIGKSNVQPINAGVLEELNL